MAVDTKERVTICAVCGELKHTPIRNDALGGYVCMTCIDNELVRLHAQYMNNKGVAGEPRSSGLPVWFVEEVCWDPDRSKGQTTTLLVEAKTCAEAAVLAGEGDGIHEIKRIVNMGPIVA